LYCLESQKNARKRRLVKKLRRPRWQNAAGKKPNAGHVKRPLSAAREKKLRRNGNGKCKKRYENLVSFGRRSG
jgi:hypothetical protein